MGKLISTYVRPSFYLSRYSDLRVQDFTDEFTTVNPNELAGVPGGGEEGGEQIPAAMNEMLLNPQAA